MFERRCIACRGSGVQRVRSDVPQRKQVGWRVRRDRRGDSKGSSSLQRLKQFESERSDADAQRAIAPLIRLALTDDGELHVDRELVRPGRGAYVHARVECVQKVGQIAQLARAFRVDSQVLRFGQVREVVEGLLTALIRETGKDRR